MTFLAPWALWVAGSVSAVVVALHILASKNPRVVVLPTTRFIPDVPLRATARALRLSDVLLLMLRVAVVMLVGVAVARPELTGARRSVGRVVVVDRSRSDAKEGEAIDSAVKIYQRGDVVFEFDSAPRRQSDADPIASLTGERNSATSRRGSMSAALAAAMRAASSLRGDADSVELVIVSPFAAEEWDAATGAIRAAWPGRVRLVRVASAAATGGAKRSVEVRGSSLDDPVRAALALLPHATPASGATANVRIERGAPGTVDSTWAKDGGALVRWPAALDSSEWRARAALDTTSAGAVTAGRGRAMATVVTPFRRIVDPPDGQVIARWADGGAAATERTAALRGCVRDVAIPIPSRGDLALRESTRRLVAALASPCAGSADPSPASDSALAFLRGTGSLVATRALESRTASPGHLTTWLLAAALALLLIEPLLRRQRAAA
ncbi:MAG: BatA domain-containing protein [Gemmatimonadaceae bacterium]